LEVTTIFTLDWLNSTITLELRTFDAGLGKRLQSLTATVSLLLGVKLVKTRE